MPDQFIDIIDCTVYHDRMTSYDIMLDWLYMAFVAVFVFRFVPEPYSGAAVIIGICIATLIKGAVYPKTRMAILKRIRFLVDFGLTGIYEALLHKRMKQMALKWYRR